MSVQVLQQIQVLEERLHCLEQPDQCNEDTLLQEKLILLKKEQRLLSKPLREAVDQAERDIVRLLEEMRAEVVNSEAERKCLEEVKERKENELQRRIQGLTQETRETEEQLIQQRAQVQAQISDLDEDLVRQVEEHKEELERVALEEVQRKDAELNKMVLDSKRQVERAAKAQLMSMWSREVAQNDQCFSEVTAFLEEITEMWSNIDLLNEHRVEHCRDLDLQTKVFRQLSGSNCNLKQRMEILSKQVRNLTRRRASQNEAKRVSKEVTHKLGCDLLDLYEQQQRQSEELQRLSKELRRVRRWRKEQERNVRTVAEVLQEIMETPESSSSLVRKMLDLLLTSTSQISDPDFALFSVRQFQRAKDDSFMEDNESRMKTLTDPLFLLRVRSNDSKFWPCYNWNIDW